MTKIYINYRRDDLLAEARSVRDGLAVQFGDAYVVLDGDDSLATHHGDIESGRAGRDVLVALIGPRWMELMRQQEAKGERDEVREEIAGALRAGTQVIPVRVGRDGKLPPALRAGDLPQEIRALAELPGRELLREQMSGGLKALGERIRRARGIGTVVPDIFPGNSQIKLWLWSAGVIASAVFAVNVAAQLTGAMNAGSFSWPGGVGSGEIREGRIRRAIAAALSAGKGADEARRCQTSLINATEAGTIAFATGSADLDRRSNQTLDALAVIIRGCPNFIIEVEGHTDTVGDPASNQRLSERRAIAVREYLVRAGVPTSAVTAVGYGDTRPVAPNDSMANMARNRRIDFAVTAR